jgi:hypothetical protein
MRPSSAPGRKNGLAAAESRDDFEHQRDRRPVKPPLLRSKSDFAPRPVDDSDTEEEIREWGARHGFEDHYQSEHIISQLASVRLPHMSWSLPVPHLYLLCSALLCCVWRTSSCAN